MLWTLHRYVLRELGRVFFVTLAVVSVVFTLVGLIQPLRREGLVSLQKLWEVSLLTFPAVLSITLPFAALFGSTMAYGRLAEDRELDACRASGVSMMTLLKPAAILAVGAGVLCFFLSNFVIGWAVSRADTLAQSGFIEAAVNQLERRGRLQLGPGSTVVAESFRYDREKRAGTIRGIIAVQRRKGSDGQDESIFVVAPEGTLVFDEEERQAAVFLGDPEARTTVEAGLDPRVFDKSIVTVEPREDRMQVVRVGAFKKIFPFPTIRARNVKHMSLPELSSVAARPCEHPRVGKPLLKIRRQVAAQEAMDWIAAKLLLPVGEPSDTPVEPMALRLAPAAESDRLRGVWYLLTAQRVELPSRRNLYNLRNVEVTRHHGTAGPAAGRARRTRPDRYKSSFAILSAGATPLSSETDGFPRMQAQFTLTMLGCSRQVPDPQNPGSRIWSRRMKDGKPESLTLDDLVFMDAKDSAAAVTVINSTDNQSLFEGLLSRLAAGRKAVPAPGTIESHIGEKTFRDVERPVRGLDAVQRLFRNKVSGEIHTRLAFAYSTVVFVLLGAAIGTIFRGGTPLKAFLISFMPWVAAMLLITFGKRLAEGAVDSPIAGVTVIWATVIGFSIVTAVVLGWLLRR